MPQAPTPLNPPEEKPKKKPYDLFTISLIVGVGIVIASLPSLQLPKVTAKVETPTAVTAIKTTPTPIGVASVATPVPVAIEVLVLPKSDNISTDLAQLSVAEAHLRELQSEVVSTLDQIKQIQANAVEHTKTPTKK
jgi:hypothetical protein